MNSKGCVFLEEGINFDLNKVTGCCISHNDGRGLPILIEGYTCEPIDWEKLFDKKAQRVAEQKEKTIYDCENCYHLSDYEFKNERKISQFHFSNCRICNAKCIYCGSENNSLDYNYDLYPVIKDLFDKGYYKPGGEATFQGGEPTLMKNFDELVNLFITSGTSVRIHSNGIKFSNTVYEALKNNTGKTVISIDSGCSKTYKKIKTVDGFETVCSNIEKYAEASKDNIILKYIIVPGYNDNLDEIDKFFNLVKKFGIKTVALDIEVVYAMKYENKYVSPHIYLIADYFEHIAEQSGVNVLTYSFLSYVMKNRKTEKSSLIKNRFLYNLYIKTKTESKKNLKYGT